MDSTERLPQHVSENRRYWDAYAPEWVTRGEDAWLPEAYRLLRSGGRLVFGHHPLAVVCSPLDGSTLVDHLVNPYFELHKMDRSEAEVAPGGIEFNLPISRWFELFRKVGFVVDDYREPRPHSPEAGTSFYQNAAWAFSFPGEQVWKLSKP